MHGKTQKNNESINNVIWKHCPKDINVGHKTLEFGVTSAVICFIDGISGVLNVLKKLNIHHGTYTSNFCLGRGMMTTFLLWRRSLQTRSSLDINIRMQKKGFY